MEYLRFRSLWGVEQPLEIVLPKIKALGYAGVECPLPEQTKSASFKTLLSESGLNYIPLIFTNGATVNEHLQTFQNQIELAQTFNPTIINSHSGRDAWASTERNLFFAEALKIEQATGARISHETHRGRILFNPWVTQESLSEFPDLHLCCDFSHWVCVCERLLDSEEEFIKAAAEHCLHIHARVGYEEGPQVPDPRAPEYQSHLNAHERWWQIIWEAQSRRGFTATTLTAEYGPPYYLQTIPYTNQPVADLWEICEWQAQHTAAHFTEWKQENKSNYSAVSVSRE